MVGNIAIPRMSYESVIYTIDGVAFSLPNNIWSTIGVVIGKIFVKESTLPRLHVTEKQA